MQLISMKERAEFLACRNAITIKRKGMMIQARAREDKTLDIRFGLTCSKKVGNAITRNRAKRRLRAVATELLSTYGKSGWDYVLIGRFEQTINRDFDALRGDLKSALSELHP